MISMIMQAQENFKMAPDELQQDIMADSELRSAASYAYMDLDTAPKSLESVILQARETIIFSKSWTVDGQTYTVRADGTVEYDPEFAYLFSTWDIPKDKVTLAAATSGEILIIESKKE